MLFAMSAVARTTLQYSTVQYTVVQHSTLQCMTVLSKREETSTFQTTIPSIPVLMSDCMHDT